MAAVWQPAPIVGGAYTDDTRPWSVQDTVNWIPVKIERPGGRSDSLLRCAPGASVFSIPGPVAPVRGMHDVEGRLFAVVGTSLYQLTAAGVAIHWGEIPGVGMVSMAHNQIAGGNELVIANGSSGYVLNTVTEQFGQITDEGFPGFKVCDFSDGYIVGVEPQGRYWFHSDLADATSYNTLDRQEAESQPDRIVSLVVSHREVLVLGERTGEFFRNTGAAQGTFQRIDGTEMEVGCAATHSAKKLDNSVIWLGNDGSLYRLNGYSPIRISTHAMEQAISRCNLAQAFAFTYEDRGHKIYYLTFPDGMTWGYDVATQELTRRESFGLERWRMSSMVRSNRQWFAGDYANGKVYRIDWAMPWENGEVIERRRISGVLHDNQNRVGIDAVEFVFNAGVGETGPGELNPSQPAGPTIVGDAPDGRPGEPYSFTYVLTAGDSPILRTTIDESVLIKGLVWDQFTATLSGTPTESGSMTIRPRVVDANGLWDQIEDTVSTMGQVRWDAATATGGTLDIQDDGVTVSGATNTAGSITADTSVSEGDWYWETTTGWFLDSGSDINHFGQTGIVRASDSANGLVIAQISATDGGAVASSDTLFAPQTLYPGWIPSPNVSRKVRIRNRLTFSGGSADWKIAIDDGDWVLIMSGQVGQFAPYGRSRGSSFDGDIPAKKATIYSRPNEFLYEVPDGAQPLGMAVTV